MHTGQVENLEKSFTISHGYELNIDEFSARVVVVYEHELERNDFELYQLIGIYVKAACIHE